MYFTVYRIRRPKEKHKKKQNKKQNIKVSLDCNQGVIDACEKTAR